MNTETLIHAMLTTNTGTHMLDSGGDCGRNWQRNQGKTLDDFKAEPAALLNWYVKRDDDGNITSAEPEVTTSVFHKLTSGIIWLDDLCREFNAMPCEDWHGGAYYGTSAEQTEWLDLHGFEQRRGCDGWNTYNWAANFSQTMQGHDLELNGENYVLIQIHGGADVRGGYTDAKLFRLSDHYEHYAVVVEDCGFSVDIPDNDYLTLDWRGEWINSDGGMADDDDFLEFAIACDGKPVAGDQYNDW
mgnify:CR=1 FL=1